MKEASVTTSRKIGDDRVSQAKVVVNGVNNGDISVLDGTNKRREDIEKEYREEMEQIGKMSSLKNKQTFLRSYVNQTLWKKKKFLSLGEEMDYKERICNRVLDDLKVAREDRRGYWIRNRTNIFRYLCIKRNNVINSLKQNFISKYAKSHA